MDFKVGKERNNPNQETTLKSNWKYNYSLIIY